MRITVLSVAAVIGSAAPAIAQQHPFVEDAEQVFPAGAPIYRQFRAVPEGAMLGGGSVADFDNDGDQDLLFLSDNGALSGHFNVAGYDLLCINNGDGTFSSFDLCAQIVPGNCGSCGAHVAVAAAIGDYDNDGWIDV